MAVQTRNDEMISLLEADFLRKRFPLVLYGAASGWGQWEFQFSTDDAVAILPATTYGVVAIAFYRCISAVGINGDYRNGPITPDNEMLLYDDGTTTVVLRIVADGSVEAQRTAGSSTVTVRLHLEWI